MQEGRHKIKLPKWLQDKVIRVSSRGVNSQHTDGGKSALVHGPVRRTLAAICLDNSVFCLGPESPATVDTAMSHCVACLSFGAYLVSALGRGFCTSSTEYGAFSGREQVNKVLLNVVN